MSQENQKGNHSYKLDHRSAILSMSAALLGAVSPALRAAKIAWNEVAVHLYFYYDGEISEEDHESAQCVATEVIAGFPEHELEIDILRWDYPKPIPQEGFESVYHRREKNPFLDDKTKLFDIAAVEEIESQGAFSQLTPLGRLDLEVMMNNSMLSAIPSAISGETLSGACIYGWLPQDIQIELLKVQIDPSLQPGMKGSRCTAFLWRFKNFSKKMNLQFSCRFLPAQTKLKGEPESGEGLIAQSWNGTNGRITMGTEDEEYLLGRSENQHWLPSRFAKQDLLIPEMIEYLEDGLRVSLPALEENEQGQIQFIVTWVEGNNCHHSHWQAVDMSYQKILELAGK